VSGALEASELRERELDRLAEDIRRHHKAVERHARATLEEAIVAGMKLAEAKARLSHGEFGPFVAYCGISPRTAQLYMKLARNRRNVALLDADSIRGALEALGGGRKKPKRPAPDFGKPFHQPRPGWQLHEWREAMKAAGRPAPWPYQAPDPITGEARRFWTTETDSEREPDRQEIRRLAWEERFGEEAP
jgi:hypothetical protein